MIKILKFSICLFICVAGGMLPLAIPALCQPVFYDSPESHIQNITWSYGGWPGGYPRYPYIGGFAAPLNPDHFQVDKVRATVSFPNTPDPSAVAAGGLYNNWLSAGIFVQAEGGVSKEDYAFYSVIVLQPDGQLYLDIGAWVDHEYFIPGYDPPPTCNLDFCNTWRITGVSRSTPITLTIYWDPGASKTVCWSATIAGQDYPSSGNSFDVGAVHPTIMKKFYVGTYLVLSDYYWPFSWWCYYFQFGIMSPYEITQGGWHARVASPQYFKDGSWQDVACALSIQGGQALFDGTYMWGGNTYNGIDFASGNNYVTFYYSGSTIDDWLPMWPVEEEPIGGCPYVYEWNGHTFVKDNNILPASEIGNGTDTYDNYKLEEPLVPIHRTRQTSLYLLQIREFEEERDYFDQTKLIAVDHSRDTNIAVTPQGEFVTYKEPEPPITCTDEYGFDHLNQISSIDGNISDPTTYFQGQNDDCLLLDFGNVTATDAALILRDDQKCMDVCIEVQVLDVEGAWHTIEVLHPRSYWSYAAVNLTSFILTSCDFLVRLHWTAPHRLDYVGLDTSVPIPVSTTAAVPVLAIHSIDGDVTAKLLYDDENVVELFDNQRINLVFALPNAASNTKRDFVFYTNGYYYTVTP